MTERMHAMVLSKVGGPLVDELVPVPKPSKDELLIRVAACAVCRTDLHVVDGELPHAKSRVIPGHEIVGTVVAVGDDKNTGWIGRRVGVPWLGKTCGHCWYCEHGNENLCDTPQFTGYTRDGGFAEYVVADVAYCLALPEGLGDAEAAPLLCAGLIGYRTLRMAGAAERLGIYGFGAAAHLVAQVARHEGRRVFAFTRAGDTAAQNFARELGAAWVGASEEVPPEPLDAALIFAPVGDLVPRALKAVRKGGVVVCGGIHMSDIPSFPYELLWGERIVRSVANLTRRDGEEFLALATRIPVHTHITTFPLDQANLAMERLRNGPLEGAAVLVPPQPSPGSPHGLSTALNVPASHDQESWSVAVLDGSPDRKTVAAALADALGLSPPDAMIHAGHTPGVLVENFSEAVSRQVAETLKRHSVPAIPVERSALPDFRHALRSHHLRMGVDALDLIDANGSVTRKVPWGDIALVGIGLVPLETTQRVDLRDAHVMTSARRSHHRPTVATLPPVLEAWLIMSTDRSVLRLDQTRMNYETLGERKSTSAAENFEVMLREILDRATSARPTPSTEAWRDRASIFRYLFDSSEPLQRSTLLTWLQLIAT